MMKAGTKTKNALQSAGTPGGQRTTGAMHTTQKLYHVPAGRKALFKEKSNNYFPVADMLPVGKENAITTAELVKLTGCTSARELQEQIARERNAGAIICSGSGRGYWRPKNRQEVVDFVRTMESRAKNTLAATSGAKKALRVADGQMELGEGDGCLM